jgi:hypothetical protein
MDDGLATMAFGCTRLDRSSIWFTEMTAFQRRRAPRCRSGLRDLGGLGVQAVAEQRFRVGGIGELVGTGLSLALALVALLTQRR